MRKKLYIISHAFSDVFCFILTLFLPLLRSEYNLNYTGMGLILTGDRALRSLFTYISGRAGDYYDKNYIIAVGFFLSSLALLGIMTTSNLILLLLAIFFLSIGSSTFHPLGTALIGREVKLGGALEIGLFEAGGVLGLMIVSFTFGLFVENWEWRYYCILLALPGFILSYIYFRARVKQAAKRQEKLVDPNRGTILLFLSGRGLRAFGQGTFVSFLKLFVIDQLGLPEREASWVLGVLFIGMIAGNLLAGIISEKKNPLAIVKTVTSIIVLVLLSITVSSTAALTFVLVGILGLLDGIFFTSQNRWLLDSTTDSVMGEIMGMAYLLDGLPQMIAPFIFGWIADSIGLVSAMRWAVLPVAASLYIFNKIYASTAKRLSFDK